MALSMPLHALRIYIHNNNNNNAEQEDNKTRAYLVQRNNRNCFCCSLALHAPSLCCLRIWLRIVAATCAQRAPMRLCL